MAQNAAIVVGIDEYANQSYCLDSCVNDGLKFAAWALSPSGGNVDPACLKLLLSPRAGSAVSGGQADIPDTNLRIPYLAATRKNIIGTVQNPPGTDGWLYTYFSCHGSSAPGMLSAVRAEPVLIPADFENQQIDNNLLIGFAEIIGPLMAVGPQTQFFFFDACRDFALESYAQVPGSSVGRWIGLTPSDLATRRSQFVLYATAPGRKATALGKGIFGGMLLDALRGAAGALDWNGEAFELRFSSLARYVRQRVVDSIGRNFGDQKQAYIQVPEWDPLSSDPDFPLRSFTREEVGKFNLKVRVGPPGARPNGTVEVVSGPGDLSCGRQDAPLEFQSRFNLWPGFYSVKVESPSFLKERRTVNLIAAHAEDVDLRPQPSTPVVSPMEEAAGRGIGPAKPASEHRLFIESPDPKLPVVVIGPDGKDSQTYRAVGSVTIDQPSPGMYRAQIELPDGSGKVRLIDFPSEHGHIALEAPPAQMGAEQMSLLVSLGIASPGAAQLTPSELIGSMADARLAAILGFAAYATYCGPPDYMNRLRNIGVTAINGSSDQAWITVLLAAEASQPAGMKSAQLLGESRVSVMTLAEDPVYRNGTFQPLSGFPLAGEFRCPAIPGPATLELRLPGFVDVRLSVITLAGRASVVVALVADDGAMDLQQYTFPLVQDPRLPAYHPPDLRDVDLAQRYYASGERFPDALLDRLLEDKVRDPLMACMAGYETVRRNKPGDYIGQPTPDAGPDVYENSALRNMLKFFGTIPDSHVLAGLVEPERRAEHFRNAVEAGIPVFVEGFAALQSHYRNDLPELLGGLAHLMIAGAMWTSWIAREPILSIENGKFEAPPSEWSALEASSSQIEALFPSVGAIEWADDAIGKFRLAGTAFLIGPDRVITSMNTVGEIAEEMTGGWRLREARNAYFNTAENPNASPGSRVRISGIRMTQGKLAVLTLDRRAGAPACKIAAPDTKQDLWEPVFIIGYPCRDSRQDPDTSSRAVDGVFGVKRLQPGVVLSVQKDAKTFDHSCFTLGGNGGSPIFSLKTGQVVGMHWGGWRKAYSRGRATSVFALPELQNIADSGERG